MARGKPIEKEGGRTSGHGRGGNVRARGSDKAIDGEDSENVDSPSAENRMTGQKSASNSKSATDTPLMRQFLAQKQKHPDALLFFRLGDFYELFLDDAVVAAKALDLTLTSRNKGAEDEVPMCGVPHHAASGYLQRLLDQGFRVALCEQMMDPSEVKGIVPREVVRVVSPGFPYDENELPSRENVFVVAVTLNKGIYGVAAYDQSTGELVASECDDMHALTDELVRLDPREIIFAFDASDVRARLASYRSRWLLADAPPLASEAALQDLLAQHFVYHAASARSACLHVLAAAQRAEPRATPRISRITFEAQGARLVLDETAQRHLEIVRTFDGESQGSLLATIDETVTSLGARLLRRRLLAPLFDPTTIVDRLRQVRLFVEEPGLRRDVREALLHVSDIERLVTKVRLLRATPRDVGSLRQALAPLDTLAKAMSKSRHPVASERPFVTLDTCEEIRNRLDTTLCEDLPLRLSDGAVIRSGVSKELDRERELSQRGQEKLTELEQKLRESSGIPTLKVRYTRVFGWYIEVTRAHATKVPASFRRKQTVATGERYSCVELDELSEKLAQADARGSELELSLFQELLAFVREQCDRLLTVAHTLAVWDVSAALAEVAAVRNYCEPTVDNSTSLSITLGRHPVVEASLTGVRFVPNDCTLHGGRDEVSLWLITGPNMGGKSTFMRQVGLITLLAQVGAYVPAATAHIGLVDRILTRVGASDNLAKGESTFMVEMRETADLLRRATTRSLVLLDEIGRGTSTFDGLSLASSIAEHLHDVCRSRTLFASHYHELTRLPERAPRIANYCVRAKEHQTKLIFLHDIREGVASRSFGIACARLAGLPEEVLRRAELTLAELEGRRDAEASQRDAMQAALTPAQPFAVVGVATTHETSTGKGGKRREQVQAASNVAVSPGAAAGTGAGAQLGLFAPEHPIVQKLRALNLQETTPMQALNLLAEWRSRI
jgi:DNA mismatch repair protein MutS